MRSLGMCSQCKLDVPFNVFTATVSLIVSVMLLLIDPLYTTPNSPTLIAQWLQLSNIISSDVMGITLS